MGFLKDVLRRGFHRDGNSSNASSARSSRANSPEADSLSPQSTESIDTGNGTTTTSPRRSLASALQNKIPRPTMTKRTCSVYNSSGSRHGRTRSVSAPRLSDENNDMQHQHHHKMFSNKSHLRNWHNRFKRSEDHTARSHEPRVVAGVDYRIRDEDLARTLTSSSCPNSEFTRVDTRVAAPEAPHMEHPVQVDTSIGTNFGF